MFFDIVVHIIVPLFFLVLSSYITYQIGMQVVETRVKLYPKLNPINSRVYVKGTPGRVKDWTVRLNFRKLTAFYYYTVILQTGVEIKLYEYELD